MSATFERPIRVGDHIKPWFHDDTRMIRVSGIRILFGERQEGRVWGNYVKSGMFVNIPHTSSLVVMFRPLTNEEVFECAQDLTLGRPCRECGDKKHRDGCRYVKTLSEMPG